jgi:hypothetical protein
MIASAVAVVLSILLMACAGEELMSEPAAAAPPVAPIDLIAERREIRFDYFMTYPRLEW